jgi:hypothetical protein
MADTPTIGGKTLPSRPELKRLDSGVLLDTYLENLREKIGSEEAGMV